MPWDSDTHRCLLHPWIPIPVGTDPRLHLISFMLVSGTAQTALFSLGHNAWGNCFLIAEAVFALETGSVAGAQLLGNELPGSSAVSCPDF